MTKCKNCGKLLKWFKDPVNEKWIPLEANCNLEYDSPEEVNIEEVHQWRGAAILTCNKGCGTQIYFDPDNRSPSGKMIPMEVETHENHTCGSRNNKRTLILSKNRYLSLTGHLNECQKSETGMSRRNKKAGSRD